MNLRITVVYTLDDKDLHSSEMTLQEFGDYIKDEGHEHLPEHGDLVSVEVEDIT